MLFHKKSFTKIEKRVLCYSIQASADVRAFTESATSYHDKTIRLTAIR